VVATVATEPKTIFRVIPPDDNLMRSMQAKLPVFGSNSKGEMQANAIGLGAPRIRSFAKSPQKGPQSDGGCLRTALDINGYFDAIFLAGFLGISSDFADAVDVLGRPRTLLDGGPCSHHIYVISH
jgi:hypothetical protein